MSVDARRYWDGKADAHSFSHPLNPDWLSRVPKDARLLDYGCGYGRTLAELAAAGWENGVGVDFAGAMVARGRREHPQLDLRHIEALPLAEPDGAFDAVILFAVLTTIADDAAQRAVMAELQRLLKPDGLLYLSDYRLQTDARYRTRYEAGAARHGLYGVWDREDGGVFRHHTPERLAELLAGFDVIAEREVATTTLSGAAATAIQILAQRPGAG